MEYQAKRILITSKNLNFLDHFVVSFFIGLKQKGILISSCTNLIDLDKIAFFQSYLGASIRIISQKIMPAQFMVSELALASSLSDLTLIIGKGEFENDLEFADQLLTPAFIITLDRIEVYFNKKIIGQIPFDFSQFNIPYLKLTRTEILELKEDVLKLDFEEIINYSAKAQSIKLKNIYHPEFIKAKIAVAKDPAFNICIPNNLELLKYYGAELIYFSPMIDRTLPKKIGAIYFPSGNIFSYGSELEDNIEIKKEITNFYKKGGVLYSEGNGTLYLANSYQNTESKFNGVGIIEADIRINKNKFLISDIELLDDSILGEPTTRCTAIFKDEIKVSYNDHILLSRIDKNDLQRDGISPSAQSYLSLGFLNFASNPRIASNFVTASSLEIKL